jgi:hypothetical protein
MAFVSPDRVRELALETSALDELLPWNFTPSR